MPTQQDPKLEPEQRCPHCGYCPHCGQARTAPAIPYPVPYVSPWRPYYPTTWGSGAISGTSIATAGTLNAVAGINTTLEVQH